ncbi:hypothetical protein B0919_02040 [Hymenobacter sp. CRA2]|nr:hypothetical protein B0919_02040 [Hymenobacter sp. CRA2]
MPALALLSLGGCVASTGYVMTEPDGVYYSSKDRISEQATASTADQSSNEAGIDDPDAVANPEYSTAKRSRGSASDEYYSDDYDYSYMGRRRYNGLGMGYNNYWGYNDPFWYSPAPFYGSSWAYSPYYGYGGWADPFWGPSWYGGSSISINIGWGLGRWGGWGPSYGYGYGYRPYGYGYGYGYGSAYYNGFYDGYYSGLYGGGRGNGYYGNWDGYRSGGRNVNYAHRTDRSVEVVGATGNGGGGRPRVDENTGGRAVETPSRYRSRVSDGAVVGGGGGGGFSTSPNGRVTRTGDAAPQQAAEGAQPGRGRLYRITEAAASKPEGATPNAQLGDQTTDYGNTKRRNGRVNQFGSATQNNQTTSQPEYSQPQPQYSRPRRESRYNESSTPSPQVDQQPTRRERSYEAPTRAYEAPTRSYEAPSRSYERSGGNFGGGGGNSGGGNSGGGGGSHGGGGRGRVN